MKFRGPQPPGNITGETTGQPPERSAGAPPAAEPRDPASGSKSSPPPRRRLKANSPIKSAGIPAPETRAGHPAPPVKPHTRLHRPAAPATPSAITDEIGALARPPKIFRPKTTPSIAAGANHPFHPVKPVAPSTGQQKAQNANDNILASKIRELIVKELQADSKATAVVKPNVKPKVRRTSEPPQQPASNQNRAYRPTNNSREFEQINWPSAPTLSSAGPHIATYHRELPVGLARLYEAVLDWRNPPPVHGSGYAKIDCLATDDSHWHIRVTRTNPQNQTFEMELQLDRLARRWVCKVVSGPESGTQIWTQALPVGRRHTDILVDFFVPGVTRSTFSDTIGIYTKLYTDLLDRDIDRMLARQAKLDEPHSDAAAQRKTGRATRVDFVRGPRAYLFETGRSHPTAADTMANGGGQLPAHVLECDHMRNALLTWSVTDHIIQCPYHKIKFDLRTGARVSEHSPARKPAPRIQIDPHSQAVTALMAETKPAQNAKDGQRLG